MRTLIPLLFTGIVLLCLPHALFADQVMAPDTIYSDETWFAEDTVIVDTNVTIIDDVTLTIEAGARIDFTGYYGIQVLGTLIAEGTETDTIVFTRSDTIGFHDEAVQDGGWWGILFNNTFYKAGGLWHGADGAMADNDTSLIDHCRIEFTKGHADGWLGSGGVEVVSFSNLVISNSEFRNNYTNYRGGGIRAYTNSDVVIRDNTIHHNRAFQYGGGIYLQNSGALVRGNIIEYNSVISTEPFGGQNILPAGGGIGILGMKPVIMDNTIRYNSAVVGAGIQMYNSFGIVKNNTISYNEGLDDLPLESEGGGIACIKGSTPKIFNNYITNNTAGIGAGLYNEDSEPVITGNLIVNNSAASTSGAMFSSNSTEIFVNNTVANNEAAIAGAIELVDSDPVFMNNILWNNPDLSNRQIKLFGYFTKLHVQNSILENGAATFDGESSPTFSNLIEDDPGFISMSGGIGAGFAGLAGDWSVATSSPGVNSGSTDIQDIFMPDKDLAGTDRIRNTIIDIGAYEAYIPSITAQDTIQVNTTWVADTVHLTGDIVIPDSVTLTVLPGTWVKSDGRYRIIVIGTIKALGTEAEPIYFTAADTTGYHVWGDSAGSWKGLNFDNEVVNNVMADNEPSVLNYCHISHVKSIEGEEFEHCAVLVNQFNGLILSNCTFEKNSAVHEPAALFLRRSDIDVTGCTFIGNTSNQGSAIWAENSDFTINACEFRENWAKDFGAAVMTNGGSLTIKNSAFLFNVCNYRGGAIYLERTKATIGYNRFLNNASGNRGGAIMTLYENFQLINNIITNNTAGGVGGGLYSLYVDDMLSVNNTICNNRANGGGGMYTAFVNHTSINDILYGNEAINYGKQYAMYSVSATINFRNTLLEGGTGEIGYWIGQELTGSYKNIMDSVPQFIRPSDGPGTDFDGTDANWNLRSVSPCINNGTLDGTDLLKSSDINGNPRIFDSLIDIGAVESQYGLPEIISQPDNYIACERDTVSFYASTRHQSYYQWQKDGVEIPGATAEVLLLEGISTDDAGNYRCIVTNGFGSVKTNPAYLLTRSAPEFVRQPEDIWAIEEERTIISSTAIGSQPLRVQWFKDGIELPGKTWPDLWINNTGAGSEGMYHCEASNACRTVSSDTIQLYLAPQICMVTLDTATAKNLVVWEKTSSAPIESYNIYRESSVAGEYEVIGNVPVNELSVYTDHDAKPAQRAYTYKITAIIDDGTESDIELCHPHKTIHLLSSLNTQEYVTQLDWDDYYGFDYGTYYIFRRVQGEPGFRVVDSIAKGNNTWTDLDAPDVDTIMYAVAVKRAESCHPSEDTKAGTGPYNHSLSNMDDDKLKTTGVEQVVAGGLKIYPNPFTERTTVEFPNPGSKEYLVVVLDLSGKAVLSSRIRTGHLVIERGSLAAGLYSIELKGEKIFRDRFVIR